MGYFNDDFSQYTNDYKQIIRCENSESWYFSPSSGSFTSTFRIEGNTGVALFAAQAGFPTLSCSLANRLNLTTFNNNETSSVSDWIVWGKYVGSASLLRPDFSETEFYSATGGKFAFTNPLPSTNGWMYLAVRKSQFIATGSPVWSNIHLINVTGRSNSTTPTEPQYVVYDDFFLVKDLPSSFTDSASWNATGGAYVMKRDGRWKIDGNTLIQNKLSASDAIYLYNKQYDQAEILFQSRRLGGTGYGVGLTFGYVDNNNYYYWRTDNTGANVNLVKRQTGVDTTIATTSYNASDSNIRYWKTVFDANEDLIEVYVSADGTNYSTLIDTYSSGLSKGYVGLNAHNALIEFDNFTAKSVGDDCNILLDNQPYYIREGTYVHEQKRATKEDLTVNGKLSWADLGPSKNQYKFTVYATNGLNNIDQTSNSYTGQLYHDNLRNSYNRLSLVDFYTPDFEYKKVHINNVTERTPDYATNNIWDRSGKSWEMDVDLIEGD